MSFDPDFMALMRSIALYAPFVDTSGYGDPSFGDPTPFACHITYKTMVVRGNTDDNLTSTAQIQLPPAGYVVYFNGVPFATPIITVDDNIVLPDKVKRRVIDVDLSFDESGRVHHQSASLT